MCSLSTFALLFAITTTLVSASPVSKRQKRDVWTGGRIEDAESCKLKCHALPKEVSDYCGYNITVLPNARGHETVDEALSEFDDFAPLLTDSPCSDHLGVLLCYHYFPLGYNCTANSLACKYGVRAIPCRDTCEAAKTESCTAFVNSSPSSGWADHLNCTKKESFPIYKLKSNATKTVCVNTAATITKKFVIPTSSVVTTKVTPASTTPKPEVTSPTEAPTTKEAVSTEASVEPPTKRPKKCPKVKACKIRSTAGGRSFTQNDYSFAIRATITGRNETDCNIYQMTVHESFDVHTCVNGVRTELTIPTGTATLYAMDGHSSDIMANMNTPVLIAGTYTGTSGDGYKLKLGCSRGTGLIADWNSNNKYTTKNLESWISRRTC